MQIPNNVVYVKEIETDHVRTIGRIQSKFPITYVHGHSIMIWSPIVFIGNLKHNSETWQLAVYSLSRLYAIAGQLYTFYMCIPSCKLEGIFNLFGSKKAYSTLYMCSVQVYMYPGIYTNISISMCVCVETIDVNSQYQHAELYVAVA